MPKRTTKKYCITFAGAVGSSKTPIATYLSGMLNLPIHNNDAIRTEVAEDMGSVVEEEWIKRRNARVISILEKGIPFILDASIDRQWEDLKKYLEKYGYTWFIISLDLNKTLLTKLYTIKGYTESLRSIDRLIADHAAFLRRYPDEVDVHIKNKDFKQRLDISHRAVTKWLGTNS